MKRKCSLVFISIAIVACNSGTSSNEQVQNQLNANDSLRMPFHESYMTDITLREVGKLIMSDSLKPMDNPLTFRLLDSINSNSQSTRDYFYPVFKYIASQSDGALSEIIGAYAMEYVSKHPDEFFNRYECCESSTGCCDQLISISKFIQYEIGMQQDIEASYYEFLGRVELGKRSYPDDYLMILFVDNLTNGMDQYMD